MIDDESDGKVAVMKRGGEAVAMVSMTDLACPTGPFCVLVDMVPPPFRPP